MSTKLPCFIIIRKTFDSNINQIELYYEGLESECCFGGGNPPEAWTRRREDAYEFHSYRAAREVLEHQILRHGNEFIVQSETEFMNVL